MGELSTWPCGQLPRQSIVSTAAWIDGRLDVQQDRRCDGCRDGLRDSRLNGRLEWRKIVRRLKGHSLELC